jgi:ABC-2 type transport system ATP-binding protein
MMNIKVANLVKNYQRFCALDHVTLQIGSGVFGLLGPNGAGKTTFMKILTTLLRPTSGEVFINDRDIVSAPHYVRQNLGYLPQDFGFYRGLNAWELLDYVGAMKNIPRIGRRQHVEQVLEQVNLINDAKRKVGGYSGGMKQRLGIAQALLGNPELLIVDEPTAGLDPEERIRFRNLLARTAMQRTVILCTHIVADIEASCNQVAVMNKGRIIFNGTLDDLVRQAHHKTWEMEILPTEYDAIEKRYMVVSSRPLNSKMILRVIAAENPLGRGGAVTPNIEDGYVAVMANAHPKMEMAQ